MLKKYKILLLVSLLIAAGIAYVLGFWLYGSYRNEREFFVGTAERSLFNALQNYYQHEFSEPMPKADLDTAIIARRHKGLLSLIHKVYPKLDLSPMKYTLDTTDYSRWRNRRSQDQSKDTPEQLLPLYLLEKIDFNEQVLDTLEKRLAKGLLRNKVKAVFQLRTEVIDRNQFDAYIQKHNERGALITRPILVNPESQQFLVAQFETPWSYLFKQLGVQILLSFLLLSALIGTFLYLLKTIRRQNQLAVLRKSFVNNMTHELKTPVATVMAAVEAIQRFVAKDDKEKMSKYLDISKNELEHLNAMIERVLQLDVDETHRIRLEKRTFNFSALVANCLETAQISTSKKVDVDFHCKPGEYRLVADESHIKNVINNLLDNAIKYSGNSVSMVIELLDKESHVQLSITDKGKGIGAEHIKHIFDMFYRVPEGNLHEVKGFGLGLAYVKQILEQHGGSIHVKSGLGAGSTFTLRIPKTD